MPPNGRHRKAYFGAGYNHHVNNGEFVDNPRFFRKKKGKNMRVYHCLATSGVLVGLVMTMGASPSLSQRITVGGGPALLTPTQKTVIANRDQLVNDAMLAEQAGKYDEAEKDAQASLAIAGPYQGMANDVLASSFFLQGKYRQAMAAYKVIADAGDTVARNEIPYALLLLKAGDWKGAVAAYDAALPTLSESRVISAESDFSPHISQPTELEAALHVAQGLNYLYPTRWTGEGIKACAMPEFEKALQLAPSSGVVNYFYGYALRETGHRKAAQAAFAKASQLGDETIKAAVKRLGG